jgi:hypothetical protein
VTIEVRPLRGVTWPDLAAALNEGFSAEALANMQRRSGYVADDSFGATP